MKSELKAFRIPTDKENEKAYVEDVINDTNCPEFLGEIYGMMVDEYEALSKA
jgi:hypothetical protein